jgi:hypothetical protein
LINYWLSKILKTVHLHPLLPNERHGHLLIVETVRQARREGLAREHLNL